MNKPDEFFFPKGMQLKELLSLGHEPDLDDLFSRSLTGPLQQLLSRPRKDLRSQLIRLGYSIGARMSTQAPDVASTRTLEQACAILELLHAGSLVIDDIEDGSARRRGQPSIHSLYGVPVALNAGNWLYFLPFQRIDELELSQNARSQLLRECHKTLLLAHYGQALDVGIPVDSLEQSRVPDVAMAAIELKSGVLASFAFKMGAMIAGADPEIILKVGALGRQIGVALQMFDDIGNLTSSRNPEKRAEDLKMKRPSFVSIVASQRLTPTDYAFFSELCSRLPESLEDVTRFLDTHDLPRLARIRAEDFLDQTLFEFNREIHLSSSELDVLEEVKKQLVVSYD